MLIELRQCLLWLWIHGPPFNNVTPWREVAHRRAHHWRETRTKLAQVCMWGGWGWDSSVSSQQECIRPKGKITVQSRPTHRKPHCWDPWFQGSESFKTKLPCRQGLQLLPLVYITNLIRKSDPTAAGAKRRNHPSRPEDTAWMASSSPQEEPPQGRVISSSTVLQVSWGPKKRSMRTG